MNARLGAVLALTALAALLALSVERYGRASVELAPEPPSTIERPSLEPSIEWSAPEPRLADPPAPRWLPVSGDALAFVAPAATETARAIVYLHGICGDPQRITEWARSAQPYGTVIALRGDSSCHRGIGHYWQSDTIFLDYRIKKAIRSVAASLGRPLDEAEVVLIGYSQGAERAEELAQVRPLRYRRVALMSGPRAPSLARVSRTTRLAVTRGERERQREFRTAVEGLQARDLGARFFELPRAAHGEFGPEGARVMAELLDHLLEGSPR